MVDILEEREMSSAPFLSLSSIIFQFTTELYIALWSLHNSFVLELLECNDFYKLKYQQPDLS